MNPSFLELFEKHKNSHKAALVCGNVSLTYAELYKQCSAMASLLRSHGVGLCPTTPDCYDIYNPKAASHSPWVVIVSERGVNAIAGVIAAWMAGGAFVLIGSDTPDAYIKVIVTDTAAAVILRKNDFAMADSYAKFIYKYPEENEIACAVFTSGSTGKPKGAVLEHRVINEMLRWQTEYMNPAAGWTATAAYAPFGFIAALWELFFPLANGLTLHILDEPTRHDLFALENYIETRDISYIFLPPNIAEIFTQTYKGKALKYLRVAGGRLKSCGSPSGGSRRGGYEIMYHLGMAENGGSVTFNPIRSAMGGDIPIGKPWNRTVVRLEAETGEMIVSGPSLFRGYLLQPLETEQRLINSEYHSGDLARLNERGEFIHMGRNDWEVKIRGMKVNPAQVEAVLDGCAGVVECCVTVQDDNLIGWVAGNTDEETLRAELSARLPEHMIPQAFVLLDKLPRNINGKADRNALVYSPLERKNEKPGGIALLFERVLGRTAEKDDSFLSLGGDSLKFMRLQAEIAREYSLNIPYAVLFQNPTPRMLGELISKQTEYKIEPIPPAPFMERYPVSEPMRQMWLLWRTGQDRGKYTVTLTCRFTGTIDKTRAKKCFEGLIRRNAILRSRFIEFKGDVFQVIEKDIDFKICETPRREFHLSNPPLFDVSIDTGILTLTAHHIIADAMAMRVLIEDFWTLYSGGEPPESAQAHSAAVWSKAKGKDDKYWAEMFSGGIPALNLPYDFARPARLVSSSAEAVSFDGAETASLAEYAALRGTTPLQLFLAAYAMLLSKLSGQDEVVVGVPFAGRDHPDTARCIGMFVKTLPIKLEPGGMILDDALMHTRERFLKAWEHQDISLARLAELPAIPRTASRNPFYDVMINYSPLPRRLPDVCGLRPEILRSGYPGALFDMILDLREEPEGVSAVFTYADELFKPETVRGWADSFKTLLLTRELDIPAQPSIAADEQLPQASALHEALKSVLDAADIQQGDDFFTIGGTSLAAIRLEGALFEAGWLLSAADIFGNPEIHKMPALMIPADEIDWEADA